MDIKEIKGKRVKLSPRSICVKSENGKTAGIITGVCNFNALTSNRKIDFFKFLNACGIWKNGLAGNTYIDGKDIYYLNDVGKIAELKKFAEMGSEADKSKFEILEAVAQKAAEYMEIIDVYII